MERCALKTLPGGCLPIFLGHIAHIANLGVFKTSLEAALHALWAAGERISLNGLFASFNTVFFFLVHWSGSIGYVEY